MGSVSLTQWLAVIFFWAIVILSVRRILIKAGYSGWWAIMAVLPLGNIIGLWLFSSADWPNLKRDS